MTLLQDVRYAGRVLRKSPAFAFTAIATLGIALGVNGAVFGLARSVLFAPLPYPAPDDLALVSRTVRASGAVSTDDAVNGRTWELVRGSGGSFDRAVFSTWTTGVNMAAPGAGGASQARYVHQQRVGTGYFRVLGVAPAYGREISPDEDRPSGPAAVVLSDALWRTLFAADPGVIGRAILLRGEPHTIVGIMPPGFHTGERADVWTALKATATGEGGGENYHIVIRHDALGGAAARAAARDTIARIGADLRRERPRADDSDVSLSLAPLQARVTARLRQPIGILWAAVAIVLLAACVNLAGVMLARTAARSREIATRFALGSGRSAVFRQVLVEAGVLGVLGGVAGIAVTSIALDTLKWLASDAYEIWQPVTPGPASAVAVMMLAIAASVGFGLGPALHAAASGGRVSLARGGRTVAGLSTHWPRRVLVVAQVALGVVLLTGAGLLVRTFVHLRSLDPGFDTARLTTASISLEDSRYRTAASVSHLLDESVARMRGAAGVEAAAASLGLPYQRLLNLGFRYLDGPEATSARPARNASATYVTQGFFEAMRIPIRRGRSFDDRDRTGAAQVAVVNDRFAREYFGGSNPLGRRIRISGVDREVVGVAGDVQLKPGWGDYGPLAAMPLVYVPLSQVSDGFVRLVHGWFQPAFVVRSAGAATQTLRAVQEAVASVDPLLPLASFRSVEEVRSAALAEQRLMMTLLLALAAAAVAVSAIGVHGLVATTVNERTREMGVRIALGSTAGAAIRTLALPGVRLAAIGTAAGLAGAVAATRTIRHFVWGVSTTDPWTFAAVAGVLFLTAATASVLPALRILRLDPATTLRQD
jgi:predicted permease